MPERAKPAALPRVDHLLDCPVIYFDAIANVGFRGPVVNAVLAVNVSEPVTTTSNEEHLIAVANLRFPLSAAVRLRDLLDKIILAKQPTPGAAN